MTKKEFQKIIKTKKVLSDHLDNFLDNLIGMLFPILLTTMFGYFSFFSTQTATSASPKSMRPLFFLSLFWLGQNIWKKLREKKLKTITTGLSIQENNELIQKLIKDKKLDDINENKFNKFFKEFIELVSIKERIEEGGLNNFEYYYNTNIPSWMNDGCTLILIAQEKEILYNIRFNGSSGGRPQYSFGLVPYHRWRIKRKIRKLLTTQA